MRTMSEQADDNIDPDEVTYGLVMPFVVCAPDGPYDSDAFVAGVYYGELDMRMKKNEARVERYVPTPLVPQIDLLAMFHGYSFSATPWEEYPEDWTYVKMERLRDKMKRLTQQ